MRPIYHIIVSVCLGLAVFAWSQSLGAFIVALLSGIFIDLDHLIDFWATRPKNPFSIKDFLDSERYNEQAKYIFVFLHGYEWLLVLLVLNHIFNWPLLLASATASFALHLALDTTNLLTQNRDHPLSYFFFFRLMQGFKKQKNTIKK